MAHYSCRFHTDSDTHSTHIRTLFLQAAMQDSHYHQTCREGYGVRYLRLPRLLEELGLARGEGRFAKLMSSYAKNDLLILDDWGGGGAFTAEQRRDMLALLDDRCGQRSILVTSQMPVGNWHELIGDPTLADAILPWCQDSCRLIDRIHQNERPGAERAMQCRVFT